MVMSKDVFKERWNSSENGDGITFDDVADCAQAWGLYRTPRVHDIGDVLVTTLKAAGVEDWRDYK